MPPRRTLRGRPGPGDGIRPRGGAGSRSIRRPGPFRRARRPDRVRRRAHQGVHPGDHGRRGGRVRLRRRRLARHIPRQRLASFGLRGCGPPWKPALPQPPRRQLRGRDREGRPRAPRLGAGSLCRRLRQRRPAGPVRDLLRPERALPQPGRRDLRRRDPQERAPHPGGSLEHGLRVPGLRPGRPPGPVRVRLHRLRGRHALQAGGGKVLHLERAHRHVRPPGPAGSKKRPLPRQRGRHLHRRLGPGGNPGLAALLRLHPPGAGLRQRRMARRVRGQRLDGLLPLPQQPRRDLQGDRPPGGGRPHRGRAGPGGHGRERRRLRPRRPARRRQDELRRRHQHPLPEPGQRALRGRDVFLRPRPE